MPNLDHGVIAQLINIPEDDSGRRFITALLASLGINVAAMIGINVTSQLRSDNDRPPTPVIASALNLVFDKPELMQPEVKPTPAPTPRPERRSRPRPTVRKARPIQDKKPPKPEPEQKKLDPEQNKPQPTPEPEPVKEPIKPEPTREPEPVRKPTIRNAAPERRPSQLQPNTSTATNATATTTTANVNTNTTAQNNNMARTTGATGEAVRTSDISAAVSGGIAGTRSQPFRPTGALASSSGARGVAANSERADSGAILVGGGNNSGAASTYRPSDIARSSGVSGASGGAVRGGSSGFSTTASGAASVASISAPSYVGRRGPAIGNTALISDSKAVLTSAMSDEGKANSGLAMIQGTRGTVATSVAVSGRSGVTGESAGRAGVGGGREIGSATVGNAAISGAGAGTSRGPATGRGKLTESMGKGSVGGASESDRGPGISTGSGNAAGASGGTATKTGGGGGPQGQAGHTGGGGGGGAAARASGGGDAGVDAKNDTRDEKKPIVKKDGDVVDKKQSGDATKRNEDADRTSDPDPELTSDMKKRQFNANLRVRVTVDVDGSHEEELIQGSGDDEIDQLIIRTMRRWKWRPAYRDGEKSKQTLTFRYKININ